MKRYAEILGGSLLFLVLSPNTAGAQGGEPPPPGCCKEPSAWTEEEIGPRRIDASQFYVTESMLQALGTTRNQFLERLSQSLFSGKGVDAVIASTRTVRRSAIERRNWIESPTDEEGLIAIEERRFYHMPLYRLQAELLDSLDQLFLTDGEIQIRIRFLREAEYVAR